jgi:hypothetical protein
LAQTQTISPAGIASGETTGTPVVTPGAVTISPSSIVAVSVFGAVTTANVLTPSGIPGVEQFGNPLFSQFSGLQTVINAGIPSGVALGFPGLRFPPSGDRMFQVAADSRTAKLAARQRVYAASTDSRTNTTPGDSRTFIVPERE